MANVLDWHRDDLKTELEKFFGNSKKNILEIACGRGEYALALAEKFPEKNIAAIDIQGGRIWQGAKQALEKKLNNLIFIRAYLDHLEEYFPKNSVEEIWIAFPDPFPKKKQAKKRLTGLKFLKSYRKILVPEGIIHLKTDDQNLFEYSKKEITKAKGKILSALKDLHAKNRKNPWLNLKTYYEQKHLEQGKNIYYLKFQFSKEKP